MVSFKRQFRLLAIGVAALCCLGAGPSEENMSNSASSLPDQTLHYKIFRKGKPIGDHHVALRLDDVQAHIDIEFAIRVKLLGITVFKMDHKASERWALAPRTLEALTAVTDRSSGTFKVSVDVAESGYEVFVNGAESQAPDQVVPTSFTLASHLFDETDKDVVLLDTLSGVLRPSRIYFRKIDDSAKFDGAVGDVRYYEIKRMDTAEVTHRIWFDETEAFFQVILKTKDGHYVEYRRQSTPL